MKKSQKMRKRKMILNELKVRYFYNLTENVEMIPYKTLQMLACRFNEGEEEKIKHHIKYRHKIAKV